MKKLLLFTLLLMFFSSVITLAQTSKVKNDLIGKWLFEAPFAPEGYTAGIIEVGYADKKYSASMVFNGNDSTKLAGDRVKFENDTLYFSVYIQGQDVAVKLKYEDKTKMTGKAVYSEGEVPLSLTHEMKKE